MRRPRIERFPGAHAVGLDLSLRATAACALPIDWGDEMVGELRRVRQAPHDLAKVKMMRAGENLPPEGASPLQRLERISKIAHAVCVFCERSRAVAVAIEDYAFGALDKGVLERAELRGVVVDRVHRTLGLVVEPVHSASARKVLLQKLPRKDVKRWVVANVRRLGGPTRGWTDDEVDSLVVANWMLEKVGGIAMSFEGVDA